MEPTLLIATNRDLPPGQRAEVVSLCSRAYEEDFGALAGAFAGATHVLAYEEGRLVSHALWVTRWLQPGEWPLLRTAYVEAVATDPDCRGRGFASAVMRRLQSGITGYDLAALSPAEHGLYHKLGWEPWRGPLAIRRGDELLETPGEEVMVLRLPRTPELDLDAPLTAEWREGELW